MVFGSFGGSLTSLYNHDLVSSLLSLSLLLSSVSSSPEHSFKSRKLKFCTHMHLYMRMNFWSSMAISFLLAAIFVFFYFQLGLEWEKTLYMAKFYFHTFSYFHWVHKEFYGLEGIPQKEFIFYERTIILSEGFKNTYGFLIIWRGEEFFRKNSYNFERRRFLQREK